jgi:A/G-specific adenine glycosylase
MTLQKTFQKALMTWHQKHNKRELPWKGEQDVYRIWVSEIILQQTRAAYGIKYFERFLKAYPTVQALAKAPLADVYKIWEGLGYYNRCRNMHATAQRIVNELGGKFPDTYDTILELKGIGAYTAAAIASFGFGLPHAVVDGNVYRVLSRVFGIDAPIDSTNGKKIFHALAQECLQKNAAAAYNQAIMDFGATVCKPDAPLCNSCPLQKKCTSFAQDAVLQYPVKEKKILQKSRWFIFMILECNGYFAVRKRTAKDIWVNLYEFPLTEISNEKEWKKANDKTVDEWCKHNKISTKHKTLFFTKPVKQQLTHQTIHARAALVTMNSKTAFSLAGIEWKTKQGIQKLPFPKLIHHLLQGQVLELFKEYS